MAPLPTAARAWLGGGADGTELPDLGRTKSRRMEQRRRYNMSTLPKRQGVFVLIVVAFLAVQFGHGCNIGVAISLRGNSKALNLGLGSSVMVGVSLGLLAVPWAFRSFDKFQVCWVCMLVDLLIILLMLLPDASLGWIYFVRCLVGFFEAPLLPYLQEWLAHFAYNSWNVWNSVLHAAVPVGECLGYILAQELVANGVSWQGAFLGQAVVLSLSLLALALYGGRQYLDTGALSVKFEQDSSDADYCEVAQDEESTECTSDDGAQPIDAIEYPLTPNWNVFWSTNVALACQLGFLAGSKYVIRDYAQTIKGFTLDTTVFSFSFIALIGPGIGGGLVMAGGVIKPDQWSQCQRTLFFLTATSSMSAVLAMLLLVVPWQLFWPLMLVTFVFAGGVYPAAQGIINISLTADRVYQASVYQTQVNNLLFAMPLPFVIGKLMDTWGVKSSFHCVVLIQMLAAASFAVAFVCNAAPKWRAPLLSVIATVVVCGAVVIHTDGPQALEDLWQQRMDRLTKKELLLSQDVHEKLHDMRAW